MESQRQQIQILFESLNPGDFGAWSRIFILFLLS